jgi:hypothetical protein
MRTAIRISTVKSRNTGEISHRSDPDGQELRLKERETGSGLIRGMGETAATDKGAVEPRIWFFR